MKLSTSKNVRDLTDVLAAHGIEAKCEARGSKVLVNATRNGVCTRLCCAPVPKGERPFENNVHRIIRQIAAGEGGARV